MAYTAGNLVCLTGGPSGQELYSYDAGSDDMATVAASGYFNNTDDELALVVDDIIIAICSDGVVTLVVSSLSSGAVTTVPNNSDGPDNGDVSAANATLAFGYSEIGSGTGSTFTLPTPVVGGKIMVQCNGSATDHREVVAGTGETINAQGDRTIPLNTEGSWVELVARSTTRWTIRGGSYGTLA